ncbi:MAG: formylglycine-generating enzyme family protein [Planctomycetes bacterium]|nr:formylglycine-generating enzyme family protein [Planctomycetota bacterium]
MGTFVHRLTGIVMHLVPGGAFVLGQDDALPRELPRQTCQLAPFLVGRFPVLQREWDLLPGDDQRAHVGGSLPISGVSWASARAWLASAGLRLPSEREWEAACRAGSTQAYPWGTGLDGRAAWFLENSGGAPRDCTLHVQQPNAFGLVDMPGNVSEWCEDDLDLPGEGSSWQEGDPGKVHRGGSFDAPSIQLRSSFRGGSDPTKAYPDLGLRAFADVFRDEAAP